MKAPVLIIDRADIAVAPPSLAENTAVLTYLTNLINTVYAKDEGEFWKEGLFSRCRPDDVHDFVLAGQLAIAWRQGSSQTDTADLMGCVRVQMLDHRTGEFGVLVCDPIFRGAGVGRDLLGFAEGWAKSQGAEVMQLEVLSPDGWEHASKARLMGWYERVGYVLVRVGEVAHEPPWLTSILVQPAKVRVYEKPL
jgi:GNAT superfamily N-acetyltransferase